MMNNRKCSLSPLRLLLAGIVLMLVMSGCAAMQPSEFEQPVVSLSSFRLLPQSNVGPRFEIGLQILNPNRKPLSFEGIYYTVSIEGYELLAGVSNELPTVEPYGQSEVLLEAGVDVIKSVQLLSSMIQQPRDQFTYSFNAKLDPGGLYPRIQIEEEGTFQLQE